MACRCNEYDKVLERLHRAIGKFDAKCEIGIEIGKFDKELDYFEVKELLLYIAYGETISEN